MKKYNDAKTLNRNNIRVKSKVLDQRLIKGKQKEKVDPVQNYEKLIKNITENKE